MNRISKSFQNTKPFIGYLTAGDGGIEYSRECALAMIEGGVDMLEIGLPFSDPVADGPTIQQAHERSLKAGTKAHMVLEFGRNLRKTTDIPLVLFSYYNPLLQKGDAFFDEIKEAGFDALLVVDLALPQENSDKHPYFMELKRAQLNPILLATPSMEEKRLKSVGQAAQGFLYFVSQKGTTGVRKKLADDFASQMTRIKSFVEIPVVAGFGIGDRDSARAALKIADGFVVGSAFVKRMADKTAPEEIKKLAQAIDPRLYVSSL